MSGGTKKVTRTVTEYKTRNSTYQVDEKAKRFRRVTGKHDPLVGPDGEWVDYTSVTHGGFWNPDGLMISRESGLTLYTTAVQSTETVALTE